MQIRPLQTEILFHIGPIPIAEFGRHDVGHHGGVGFDLLAGFATDES